MRAFGRRIELMRRCVGESRATRTPVDLSGVLGDARALQELVADLWLPFAQQHVDVVVALHEQNAAHAGARDSEVHHFTSAIAGAVANARQLALSEATVLVVPQSAQPETVPVKKKKRGRTAKSSSSNSRRKSLPPPPVATAVVVHPNPDFVCQRVVCLAVGAARVELKRQTIRTGNKVLVVLDWVDRADAIVAARTALTSLGAEVVGVAFVVATSATVLQQLKAAQLLVSCSWTPPLGAAVAVTGDESVTRSIVPVGERVAVNITCSCHQPQPHRVASARKRRRSVDGDSSDDVTSLQPPPLFLTHVTAQYQGNNPSEDRSVNIVSEGGLRMFAVLDGHGGSLAVEHLRAMLLEQIASELSIDAASSEQQVTDALKRAFVHCDDTLKQSLLALPAETRLAKGFCNSGACAAVALFLDSVLYVANVGDCAVVLGKTYPKSQSPGAAAAIVATQLSVDHSCSSAEEVRLVLERSRDRNAIRLSRDDQASGAGGFGVKRVAGSLAVTRAFGDFYLKCEDLSAAPFKSKLPYITVEPSVSAHRLDGRERFLILGSDGLWEVLTPDEAVQIVETFEPAQTLFFASASAALIHAALEKIAHRDGLMLHEVLALPPGPTRRRLHDDITCTVVYLHHEDDSAGADNESDDVTEAEAEAEAEPETVSIDATAASTESVTNGNVVSEATAAAVTRA